MSKIVSWGVYRYRFWAYSLYFALGAMNLPKALGPLLTDPTLAGAAGVVFTVLCMMLAWWLRAALYPDLGWFRGVKKQDGEYRFAS